MCARAAPGFLAEGLIGMFPFSTVLTEDPDYTFLAMTRFSEGLKKFWTKIFGRVGLVVADQANQSRAKRYGRS